MRDSWMLPTRRRNIGETIRWNSEAMVSVGRHSSYLFMAFWLVWATDADDETQDRTRADHFGCRAPTTPISVEHRPSTGAKRTRRPSPTTRPRSRLWLRCWSAWWPPSSMSLFRLVWIASARNMTWVGLPCILRAPIEMPGTSARGRSPYRLLTSVRESATFAATAAPRGRSWPSSGPWGSSNPRRPSRCPLRLPRLGNRMLDSQDEPMRLKSERCGPLELLR